MAQKLKVTLVRSGIGRPGDQCATLLGLGLKRLNRSKVLEDTPAIRGMIRKVQHLVRVQPADGEAADGQ
jgi:large subunit ribosomal protein L30